MVLNYIHGRANVISYHYQDRVTTYNAYSWDDFRAKLRTPFETDFNKYGVVTGTNGHCYIVNGEEIRNVVYNEETQILIVTFKDYTYCWLTAVTNEIGLQHKRYLDFVKDCNNLAEIRKNRNIKLVVSGADQSEFVFPSFDTLQDYIMPGDYVIVESGTITMTDAFTFKNGVDIEIRGTNLNVQYSEGYIRNAVFTDATNPFTVDTLAEYDEVARTDKIIKARIFGTGNVDMLDIPSNAGFMPIIRSYYNSELYAQFRLYNYANGAVLYSTGGHMTARIETVTNCSRLIDNDYKSEVMDFDGLNVTITDSTFFPGTDVTTEGLAIVRNASISGTNRSAIQSIASGTFTYHYINSTDAGSALWYDDLLAATTANFYMHNSKISTDEFTSATHNNNWYNSGFTNYRDNSAGGGNWNYYDDSLITT